MSEIEHKTETVQDLVTDKQVDLAWGNANFGKNINKRKIIALTILKCASGYYSGSTATRIVEDLGLVTEDWKLSHRGKVYLFVAFEEATHE